MTFRVGAPLAGWSRQLRTWSADHAEDLDVVLVRDARGALQPDLHVFCADLDTLWVTPQLLDELRDADVVVVGIFADDAEDRRWVDLGVDHRLRADVSPELKVHLLERLRPATSRRPTVPTAVDGGAGPAVSPVVIGGPSGSGAREVAVGIADRLARYGSTIIVDANECGGTVAVRLNLADHPNLIAAAPVVAGGGDLARAVATALPGRSALAFDVIAGLPSAAEWSRVTAGEVHRLVQACALRWEHVVVVTGPRVEDLHRWVDRYGTSRELLATASTVVGVCAATPRGVLAFAEWLADTRPPCRVQTVINRIPASSPFVRGEVADRLRSLCGDRVEVVGAVPWDRRVVRAEWDGVLVRRGPYAKALDRTVEALTLDSVLAPGVTR